MKSTFIVPVADAELMLIGSIMHVGLITPAVIFPAAKLPDASLATMAKAVLVEAAVVAELETFPAVDIVASFVSTIAAAEPISAFTIELERFNLE